MKRKEDTYVRFILMYCSLHKKGYTRLAKLFYWLNRIVFGCDIPCSVSIGKQLHLPHFGLGVVIHPSTIIGNGVTIYQQVTIGARNGKWNVVVMDNVILGEGSKILGDITIGNNSKVGANCVLLESLPSGKTAVGVPAKIL